MRRIQRVLLISVSVYHLYVSFAGLPAPMLHRPIHIMFFLSLAFLIDESKSTIRRITNILFATLAVVCLAYVWLYEAERIGSRTFDVSPVYFSDVVLGVITLLLILEATRRRLGIPLVALALCFIGYTLLGHLIPGRYGHPVFTLEQFVDHQYLYPGGLFGVVTSASANYVIIFVIFSAFLQKSGIGDTLMSIAKILMGRSRGGPAKMAVIASAFMGTLSGSTTANVVTTGSITIPLMKKTGYSPKFAGGTEACASLGGQLMPPVMGAGAFIMAQVLGMSYLDIITAALLPAILYFFGVLVMVHLRALKRGLRGISEEEVEGLKKDVFRKFYQLFPVVILVWLLIQKYSPYYAAFWAIILVVLSNAPLKRTRMSMKDILDALELGGRQGVVVALACGTASVIVGTLTMTGGAVKMTSLVSTLAGGSLEIALVLTMIVVLILGMGLPTTAAYITGAAVMAPVITYMGVESAIAAHLFIFYFACISAVTPPVATGSYVAAGIAGSQPFPTALMGARLAFGGFIVPFIFVLGKPLLLMDGPLVGILAAALTAMFIIVGLAMAIEGWGFVELHPLERLGFTACAGLLILQMIWSWAPGYLGIIGIGILTIVQIMRAKRKKYALGFSSVPSGDT